MFKHKFKVFLLLLLTNIIVPLNVFAYSDYILAGGQNIGIELDSNGIIIVGTYNIGDSNPATSANLKTGDKIIKVNSKTVTSISEMLNVLDQDLTHDEVNIEYMRGKSVKSTIFNIHSSLIYTIIIFN